MDTGKRANERQQTYKYLLPVEQTTTMVQAGEAVRPCLKRPSQDMVEEEDENDDEEEQEEEEERGREGGLGRREGAMTWKGRKENRGSGG